MARKPVLIRMPEELYDALAKWADDKLRSTNAQIEYLLQDAVKKAGRSKKPKTPRSPTNGGANETSSREMEATDAVDETADASAADKAASSDEA